MTPFELGIIPAPAFNYTFMFSLLLYGNPDRPLKSVTSFGQNFSLHSSAFSSVRADRPARFFVNDLSRRSKNWTPWNSECSPFFILYSDDAVFQAWYLEGQCRLAELNGMSGMYDRKFILFYDAVDFERSSGFTLEAACNVESVVAILVRHFDHYDVYYYSCKRNVKVLVNVWYANDSLKYDYRTMVERIEALKVDNAPEIYVGTDDNFPMSSSDKSKGIEIFFLEHYARGTRRRMVVYTGDLGCAGSGPNATGMIRNVLLSWNPNHVVARGLYSMSDLRNFGEFSNPTSLVRVTCLVPRPKKTPLWVTFYVFRPSTWLTITMIYFLVVFLLHLLEFAQNYTMPDATPTNNWMFVILRMFLDQSNHPNRLQQKIAISGIFISVILTHTFYSSKLSSFMTSGIYDDDIRTLEDLASSNLPILLYASNYEQIKPLEYAESGSPLSRIIRRYRNVSREEVRRLLDTEVLEDEQRFALVVDWDMETGFYSVEKEYKQLKHMKPMIEPLIPMRYTGIFLQRGSALLPSMNRILGWVRQHGFDYYWKQQTALGEPLKVQRIIWSSFQLQPEHALRLEELHGHFIILLVGHLLATITFTLEQLTHHLATKN